ncbi:MAG: kinase, partial [Gammaproteobacteria bacterium]
GPGRLRMTLVEQHCTRFLRTFISIIRGRPNRNAVPQSGYISHNADRIQLSMDGGLNLDGEIIHARGPVSIDTTESLRFLRL